MHLLDIGNRAHVSFYGYYYELSNHLGNVLAVVSDRKLAHESGGISSDGIPLVDYYDADVTAHSEYYPFGMVSRSGTDGGNYRYGFNGMEADHELKGMNNSLDFGERIYDPRISKFLSLDPKERDFASMSHYSYAANNPIFYIDLKGESPLPAGTILTSLEAGVLTAEDYVQMEKFFQEALKIMNTPKPLPKSNPASLLIRSPIVKVITVIADSKVDGQRLMEYQYSEYIRLQEVRKEMPEWKCTSCVESTIDSHLDFLMTFGAAVMSSEGDVEIFTNDPSTLPDFYLQGVMQRIARGVARPSDLKYQAEAESRGIGYTIEGPVAGGGASLSNLSYSAHIRIQKIADKYGLTITVVGSQAEGTADANSDWDYIIEGGNSKARSSALYQLPKNPKANKDGDPRPGSEILKNVDVDPEKPHITYTPNTN